MVPPGLSLPKHGQREAAEGGTEIPRVLWSAAYRAEASVLRFQKLLFLHSGPPPA